MKVTIDEAYQTALRQQVAGESASARSLCDDILRAAPTHAGALHLLGIIEYGRGAHLRALALIDAALAQVDHLPAFHCNRGEVLRTLGRGAEAEASYRRALALDENFHDAHYNLANVLMARGELEGAGRGYESVLRTSPRHLLAWMNLGLVRCQLGELEAGVDCYLRAIAINPGHGPTWVNLAVARLHQDDFAAAERAAREALRLAPCMAEAWTNLGRTLLEMGRVQEAIAASRLLVDLHIATPGTYSNLLLMMQYDPRFSAADLRAAHAGWAPRCIGYTPRSGYHGDRDPDRRLRVGYVSGDFRNHAATGFILPLLRRRDRDQFHVTCYNDVRRADDITALFRASADEWRDVSRLTDAHLAELINDDRIDVLVDCSGHTAVNRLPVFAVHAAPVQVQYAAYHEWTGLDNVCRISDRVIDGGPPASEAVHHVEGCALAWSPMEETPDVTPEGPMVQRGHVTFGAFNGVFKLSDPLLDAWARLLAGAPDARMHVLIGGGEPAVNRLRDRLVMRGVDPGRLTFFGKQPRATYMRMLGEVDVLLDATPYNGQTTTMESLWMGVPVVTWSGGTAVSRVGASILTAIGLRDLVASDASGYVETALRLGHDEPRLRELRRGLRERHRATFGDRSGTVRVIEGAIRERWRRWCDSDPEKNEYESEF